mgnify:CR=1 FL=1
MNTILTVVVVDSLKYAAAAAGVAFVASMVRDITALALDDSKLD